ncbi:MAG: GFA family protein [Gammaproteobacteria bacterium]|jgi:hypothetical protein|nr:GFA family protein [Gammaproteobacteria bacterium]MBT7371882.1 GFA family protein [Gammaproteobacteria bacterium]
MSGVERGGCLCGAIRYEFTREKVITSAHCHCTDCQKATGSGKATIVFVPADELKIEGELKVYSVVGTDGGHVSRGFCPECGSPIISFVAEQPGVKFIKAGSLDDPSWIRAQASYWSDSAHDWSPVDMTTRHSTGNPEA